MPVADDMAHVQVGELPDARFFRRFSELGHYGEGKGPYGTRQGYYAATPDGELLGSNNAPSADPVVEMLTLALARWDALSPEAQSRTSGLSSRESRRWEAGWYPRDGLVLVSYARDLPVVLPDHPVEGSARALVRSPNWNMDYVWFKASEARAMVPSRPTPGARVAVPRELVERLAMFTFIDVVNGIRYGQHPAFGPAEVSEAELTSTVEWVRGSAVGLSLSGSTHASGPGAAGERGVTTQMLGRATFDTATRRFTGFELVAVGMRWGGTGKGRSFDRAGESAPRPIGFDLSLAGTTRREQVPPIFLMSYGW